MSTLCRRRPVRAGPEAACSAPGPRALLSENETERPSRVMFRVLGHILAASGHGGDLGDPQGG